MNKQVDEMTRDLCEIECKGMKCNTCDAYGCKYRMWAEALYNAGYRKQERGEWVKDGKSKFKHRYHCSACNFYLIGAPTKHCPNCGARMKGEEDGKAKYTLPHRRRGQI